MNHDIIFVLDAGGTGFKFSAVRDYKEIIEPFTIPTVSPTHEALLQKLIDGFHECEKRCGAKAKAISFCFPGPADYPNGIIGDLPNIPSFRGGVALKAMLEDEFHLPVFINNDGDLFVYGEALGGLLPRVNEMLERKGNPKRYKNLFGVTLGTGFGGGVVINKVLINGDNSAGGEIWCSRNCLYPDTIAEESVSIRGVQRVYAREAGIAFDEAPQPFDIFKIAQGVQEGSQEAALMAWDEFSTVLADVVGNGLRVTDGLVVIGGGLSGAWPVFMPMLIKKLNEPYHDRNGNVFPRMETEAFNLENEADCHRFAEISGKMITVPFSDRQVWYDPTKRVGVGITKLGTSSAVAIGAYAYAMNQLG